MDEDISRREFVRTVEVGGVMVMLAGCQGLPLDDLETEPTDTTMQQQRQDTDKDEPVTNGRFEVQIDGVEVTGWQTVTIPGKSIEQDSYRTEDGATRDDDATTEKERWGQVSFDDLEMERGVKPGDTKLHDWFEDVRAGAADAARKEIAVKLQNEEGHPMIQWEFTGAWVKEYSPPELDASADGDTATESITVAFDRMERDSV